MILLAEHFLARHCAEYGLPAKTLAPDARAALLAHPWRGNVRELTNTMERVALSVDAPVVTAALLDLSPVDDDPSRSRPSRRRRIGRWAPRSTRSSGSSSSKRSTNASGT